jgi:fructoselysine-6-P-deglycase FrlB-like protein
LSQYPDASINQAQSQFLAEIIFQQTVLPDLVRDPERFLNDCYPDLNALHMILGLGEGSSYFALQLAQPWLGSWLGKPVMIAKPLNWLNDWPLYQTQGAGPDITDMLMVSQSGETGSLKYLLDHQPDGFGCDRQWLFTNQANSTLAQQAGLRVDLLDCPVERSIPATVTMSASWLALLCWGVAWLPMVEQHTARHMLNHAVMLPWLTNTLANTLCDLIADIFTNRAMVLLGQYHTASPLAEVALKLMETSGQLVLADRIENFSHGPKAILASLPNVCVWAATDEGVHRAEQLQQQFPGLPLLLIGLGVRSAKVPTLALPKPVNDLACQLMTLITGQLLSWALCVTGQRSPNHPLLTKHVGSV